MFLLPSHRSLNIWSMRRSLTMASNGHAHPHTSIVITLQYTHRIPIKTNHSISSHSRDCRPIFKILSLIDSQKTLTTYLWQKLHLILTTLLHGLVRFEIQNMHFMQQKTSSFQHQMPIKCIWANVRNVKTATLKCRQAASRTIPLTDNNNNNNHLTAVCPGQPG